MAVIISNEEGIVAVNNAVISKLIIKHLINLSSSIEPCNQKGKILKGPKNFEPGFYPAVEIKESHGGIDIKFYFCIRFGVSMKEISNTIFDLIEKDFEMLHLSKPAKLVSVSKGTIINGHINERNEQIVRINENNIR